MTFRANRVALTRRTPRFREFSVLRRSDRSCTCESPSLAAWKSEIPTVCVTGIELLTRSRLTPAREGRTAKRPIRPLGPILAFLDRPAQGMGLTGIWQRGSLIGDAPLPRKYRDNQKQDFSNKKTPAELGFSLCAILGSNQ